MYSRGPNPFVPMFITVLVAAAILLVGGAASQFMYINDMNEVYKAQSAELKANPSVFTITAPEDQVPQDTFVAKWSSEENSRHFVLRAKAGGGFTLSNPDEPTAVIGRTSGTVGLCSKLHLKEGSRRHFSHDGTRYRLILTYQGNAAVCRTT